MLPLGEPEPGSPAFPLCRTCRDRPGGRASSPAQARVPRAVLHLGHPRTSDWARFTSCPHPRPLGLASEATHPSFLRVFLTDLLAPSSSSICVFQEQPVWGPCTSWENGYCPCSHLESAWMGPWKSIAGLCPDNARRGHAPTLLGHLGGRACPNLTFSFWEQKLQLSARWKALWCLQEALSTGCWAFPGPQDIAPYTPAPTLSPIAPSSDLGAVLVSPSPPLLLTRADLLGDSRLPNPLVLVPLLTVTRGVFLSHGPVCQAVQGADLCRLATFASSDILLPVSSPSPTSHLAS